MSLKKYDRNFKDPGNLSQVLFCPICQEIFKRPVIISCGHTFCKHCIATSHIKSKFCPTCRQRLSTSEKFIRNVFAEQIIDEQIVICEQELCKWEGPLSGLENHKKHCEFCPKVIENLIEEQHNQIIITDDNLSSEDDSSSSIQIVAEKSTKTISKLKKRKSSKEIKNKPQKKIHCLEEEEEEDNNEDDEKISIASNRKDEKQQEDKFFFSDEEEQEKRQRLKRINIYQKADNYEPTFKEYKQFFEQNQKLFKGSEQHGWDSLEIFSDQDDQPEMKKQFQNAFYNNQHQKIDQNSHLNLFSQNLPLLEQETYLKNSIFPMRNIYLYGLEEIEGAQEFNRNCLDMNNNLEQKNGKKEVILERDSDKEDNNEINQNNQAVLTNMFNQNLIEYSNQINNQPLLNVIDDINIQNLEQDIQQGEQLRQEQESIKESQKETNELEEQEKERRKRQEEWDRDCERNPLLPLLFGFEA